MVSLTESLGGMALLVPGFPRLKESAYAGATFVYTGAIASHLAVDDHIRVLVAPLFFLGLTFAFWCGHRKNGRRQVGRKHLAHDSGRPGATIRLLRADLQRRTIRAQPATRNTIRESCRWSCRPSSAGRMLTATRGAGPSFYTAFWT